MELSSAVPRAAALWVASLVLVAGCSDETPDPLVALLEKHAGVPDPPGDLSNKYIGMPAAIALGKQFYFDASFSGRQVDVDMLLRPMTTSGRAPLAQPIDVSCNTCHDVTRGGADQTTDPPGRSVSFGAGAYDVNGQQTVNSAYADLLYWNGRNDSLWSQVFAVVESHVSLNGSRMRTAWRIADAYRAEYQAAFPAYPLPPQLDSIEAHRARLAPDGTCKLVDGACPPEHCHETYGRCTPRFPLEAKPGFVKPGQLAVCDPASADEILQPYGDAWDCMTLADQLLATRIFVNFAKAIAAYEYTLLSRDSPFDRWAANGFPSGGLGAAAERGARLFVGKAACRECHAGPLFTDNKFHQIGVAQLGAYIPKTTDCEAGGWCDCESDDRFEPMNCLPEGARDGLRKLQASRFRRDSIWSDDEECRRHFTAHIDPAYALAHPDECDGRVKYYSMPLTEELVGAWRTPGLRDVALSAPYMHQGMYETLRDVVAHYARGGVISTDRMVTEGGELVGRRDPVIQPIQLTDQEIDDLVAFLESLTSQLDTAVTTPPVIPRETVF